MQIAVETRFLSFNLMQFSISLNRENQINTYPNQRRPSPDPTYQIMINGIASLEDTSNEKKSMKWWMVERERTKWTRITIHDITYAK